MKQGEIWSGILDPTVGSEQAGFRPVVIISGDAMNDHMHEVIICPLTTQLKRYKANVILEPTESNRLKKTSEIICHQVRYLAKHRLVKKIGNITKEELEQTKKGLNEILTY